MTQTVSLSSLLTAAILYGSLLRDNKKEDFVTVLVAQAK